MDYTPIEVIVNSTLSPKRLRHSKSTAAQARELMTRFSTDPHEIDSAFAVGLWHDMAREWSDDALLSYCLYHKLAMEPEELAQPMLLHGLVASALLPDTMAESSPSWNLAVRWHTLGSRTMGILGAVLYIADFLEPTRTHLDAGERKALLESHTLEEMCIRILCNQDCFLRGKGIPTAHTTSSLMEFLLAGGRF
jgi:HD superfamily phosphohydrolase YqeK